MEAEHLSTPPLITVENVTKWFPVRRTITGTLARRPRVFIKAVEGINIEIRSGEIFGLVGESGSGKTTTGRMVVGLTQPTSGKIKFKDADISSISKSALRKYHQKAQIIFQDPYESLSPRLDAYATISEPIRIHHLAKSAEEEEKMVLKALEDVELIPPEEFMHRLPHELSGGQRQRLAMARSLVLKPELIVADEPVSMLDVSIRAEVLNLLKALRESQGITILLITHDLAVARNLCDRIAIMYLGKVMEKGPVEEVIFKSLHPYTRALIAAVPSPDPTAARARAVIKGEIPSPISPPSGCRFHPRCPSYLGDICKDAEPRLISFGQSSVACHLYPVKHTMPIPECCGAIPVEPIPTIKQIDLSSR